MIKANELRIGNYLQLDSVIFHVYEIYNDLQSVELRRKNLENPKLNDYEECDLDCNDLQPIPLTEELILKFGFKKIKFLNEYFVEENGYKHLDMIIRYGCFDGHRFIFDFANDKCVNLKYVHQLQNLYFALCGEELVFSTES